MSDSPIILKTAVATPLMLRYALLRKALSTNGVVSNLVIVRSSRVGAAVSREVARLLGVSKDLHPSTAFFRIIAACRNFEDNLSLAGHK
jgi:hypothetical protein